MNLGQPHPIACCRWNWAVLLFLLFRFVTGVTGPELETFIEGKNYGID